MSLNSLSIENLLNYSFKSNRGINVKTVYQKCLKAVFKKGFNLYKEICNFSDKIPNMKILYQNVQKINYKKQFNDLIQNTATNSVKVNRLYDLFKTIPEE